jgi:hypothetical protein
VAPAVREKSLAAGVFLWGNKSPCRFRSIPIRKGAMGITNQQSRSFVQQCVPFHTNNNTLYGEWTGRLYVVFSYGNHWPLFIYDPEAKVWFENSSRYSNTTSKHRTQARPISTDSVERVILEREVDWMRKCVDSNGMGIREELLVKSLPLC